jgi:hypothetical protein
MRSHGLPYEECVEDLEETMALYLSQRGDSGSGPLCRSLCRINRALRMVSEVLGGCTWVVGARSGRRHFGACFVCSTHAVTRVLSSQHDAV